MFPQCDENIRPSEKDSATKRKSDHQGTEGNGTNVQRILGSNSKAKAEKGFDFHAKTEFPLLIFI